jgi:hypothetical protein
LCTAPAGATIVNPIYATTYTGTNFGFTPVSLVGNVDAQAAISRAAAQINGLFGATNTTVNILFYGAHTGTNSFLGASTSGGVAYSYADYTAALTKDANKHLYNKALQAAVQHLSAGNGAGGNPATTFVAPTTSAARALGLGLGAPTIFGPVDSTPEFDSTGTYLGGGGTVDGIVFLNLDQPLSYYRPIQSVSAGVAYDAQQTVEHEMDEVLGIGGAGSTLNDLLDDPTFATDFYGVNGSVYGPMDLFRYSAPGVASYSVHTGFHPADKAYFSVDGGNTSIDAFNQEAMAFGDAADWGLNFSVACPGGSGIGGAGNVQDAFSCNNQAHNITPGSPEYLAYEAIGYNPIPEPATFLLFGMGLLGAVRLRKRG